MWKTFQLTQSVYDRFLYSHPAKMIPSTETILLETRFKERIPFHLSSLSHLIMLCSVFHFLSRCLLELNFKYIYLLPIYIALAVFITMHLLFVLMLITMGNEILESLTHLLQLERELIGTGMKPVGYATQVGHYKLLSQG